jgi:SAM-dependent methyltransferase
MNERDWDRVADRFEDEIFNVPANDRKGIIAGWVRRLGKPGATATDLGCGVGRTLPMLAERFGKVYAVDVSSQCLDIAANANRGHANIAYVHADLSTGRNPYPAADAVLCINTWLNADPSIRERLIARTCRSVKKGGHLLLVVPSLNSALLAVHRHAQWNRRNGLSPRRAQRAADLRYEGIEHGLVRLDDVPTKHYQREELECILADHGFAVLAAEKIEYPWSTEFEAPPRWMQAPYPWDWFIAAQRKR